MRKKGHKAVKFRCVPPGLWARASAVEGWHMTQAAYSPLGPKNKAAWKQDEHPQGLLENYHGQGVEGSMAASRSVVI